MSLHVRPIHAHEIDAWCACPHGTEEWTAGERAWLERWHRDARNLFACVSGGAFLGKYDVPMEEQDRWTLWAPSVRDGPDAAAVMEALCRHVRGESRRRGIARVEVTLEQSHPRFGLARRSLLAAGFRLADERLVFVRDLADPLPELPDRGLAYGPAAGLATAELAALCRDAGLSGDPPPDARRLGVVARRGGTAVGLALPSSLEGELVLHHVGIVPEARGRGYGLALLAEVLRRARDAGATSYVGSTSKDNRPMHRVFERLGCGRPQGRLVFRLDRAARGPEGP